MIEELINLPAFISCRLSVADVSARASAVCRARKQAYNEAVQAAFSRFLLVRLSDPDRVHVEVDTTVEERILYDESLDRQSLLQVSTGECLDRLSLLQVSTGECLDRQSLLRVGQVNV